MAQLEIIDLSLGDLGRNEIVSRVDIILLTVRDEVKKMSSVSIKIDHPKGTIRYPDNFPNKEGENQYRYGFTLYKDVIIQWDKERDERIFSWYDSLPEKLRKRIIVAQEHEGMLYLVLDKEMKIQDIGTSWNVEGEVWKLAEDEVRVKGRGVAY